MTEDISKLEIFSRTRGLSMRAIPAFFFRLSYLRALQNTRRSSTMEKSTRNFILHRSKLFLATKRLSRRKTDYRSNDYLYLDRSRIVYRFT